ncbi:hypothetical protein [Chromobacterium alkanivorans]|uniref:hypothetical protein n=1 Tax=Chromobacterium alkanivorans TaxID=1071719 RepID=UPI0021689F92|nr:hypothetical protein [Chromobacterium alkanivorans]MCS3805678.1 hypothetical protein [Chromobacterium alkanivorans]MCS3820092.1 hypothetical protein [Chromobacterium alkanivorans]
MGEFLQLLKALPVSLNWLVTLILLVACFLYLFEKSIAIYANMMYEGRKRKAEEVSVIDSLVMGDRQLELLNEESKLQQAFFRISGLNVNKRDRENVLNIYRLVPMRYGDLKYLYDFLGQEVDGKYQVQIGLGELFQILASAVMMLLIAVTGMKVALIIGGEHAFWQLGVGFSTMALVFLVFALSLSPILKFALVRRVSKRLAELGKLDGEPGWKYQVKTAWEKGWKILFGIIVFFVLLAWGSYSSL